MKKGTTTKLCEDFKTKAINSIIEHEGRNVLATITSVSKSGMSRRIKFYWINDDQIYPITHYFEGAQNTNGLYVRGYGMDMIFATLSYFYMKLGIKSEIADQWATRYQII